MNEEKFRCHPSIILEKIGGVIAALLFILIGNLDDAADIISEGTSFEYLLVTIGIIVILIIILVYNIMVWSKTFISIEENTIVIQKNTINAKVNTFGIKNIANVNLEQNIFERIIGTYKIKIDTDSLSTADKTDIEIVLSKAKAYEFKNKIISLMNDEKEKNSEKDENSRLYIEYEKIDYDIVYSPNDVLKHCFYNLSLMGLIFNLGLIGFSVFISISVDGVKGILATAVVFLTACSSILKFFIGDLFKYYNFSVKRSEDKLYLSYGLFRIKKFTVPVNRINAININQKLISRISKRYQSDIVTIGVGDDESEGSQILLSSSKEDFIKNMKILLPELNMEENLNLQKESENHQILKAADVIIRTIFCSLILYVIYTFNTVFPAIVFWVIDLGFLLVMILINYLSYKTRGLYMGEDNLSVSWGAFSRKISIIKYEKLQYITIKENVLSSKLNLCRCELNILASMGNSIIPTGYYKRNIVAKLKNKFLND